MNRSCIQLNDLPWARSRPIFPIFLNFFYNVLFFQILSYIPIFFKRMKILLKKSDICLKNDLCVVLNTIDNVYKKADRW
jgi:hypothetical protein